MSGKIPRKNFPGKTIALVCRHSLITIVFSFYRVLKIFLFPRQFPKVTGVINIAPRAAKLLDHKLPLERTHLLPMQKSQCTSAMHMHYWPIKYAAPGKRDITIIVRTHVFMRVSNRPIRFYVFGFFVSFTVSFGFSKRRGQNIFRLDQPFWHTHTHTPRNFGVSDRV